MKKLFLIPCVILLLTGCGNKEKQLSDCDREQLFQRAYELCQYIPDHELLPEAEAYMTPDFFQALSGAFNAQSFDPMDNEWLYYFVTGNGGSTPIYTIDSVNLTDDAHVIAYVSVQQKWDDGTLSEEAPKQHRMEMTMVDGKWLMSDFDSKKQECLDYAAEWDRYHSYVAAVNRYLTNEIGKHYATAEVCIPCPIIVAKDESNPDDIRIWGDFWVFNYNIEGDVLKTVSGGSHPGQMHLRKKGADYEVFSFDQVEDGAGNKASAQRIFGDHFESYWALNSCGDCLDITRKKYAAQYAQEYNLSVHYFQDYGWPAEKFQ